MNHVCFVIFVVVVVVVVVVVFGGGSPALSRTYAMKKR